MPSDIAAISKWLRERGWRKNRLGHWYKPLPGWCGRCTPNQRICNLGSAFDEERASMAGLQERREVRRTFGPNGAA